MPGYHEAAPLRRARGRTQSAAALDGAGTVARHPGKEAEASTRFRLAHRTLAKRGRAPSARRSPTHFLAATHASCEMKGLHKRSNSTSRRSTGSPSRLLVVRHDASLVPLFVRMRFARAPSHSECGTARCIFETVSDYKRNRLASSPSVATEGPDPDCDIGI
jgi:hypothetical protein